MATSKQADAAAAKAKKQKIILAVAGVALLGLGAIQGPKLMKGGGGSTATPPAAESSTAPSTATAVSVSTPTGATATAVKVTRSGPTAVLAGVKIQGGGTPAADTAHLVAFTLFEVKDPFVQQGEDGTTSSDPGTVAAPADKTEPTASGGSSGAGVVAAPKPPPIAYATIMLDGKPQQLEKKQKFPTGNPMFVLVALKKNQAKIGVAGGAFDDGKTVTLVQGKKLTLVDTATGVRYVLKLVYTGSTPEQIEGFSSGTTGTTSGETPAPSVSNGTTTAAPTP